MSHVNKKSTAARNAFTLIELLTVVTIIVLLIGIIAPSIGTGLKLAKKATAAAYLNSVAAAALQYHTDNDSLYPGQDRTSEIDSTDAGKLSGSQMLAACLLDGLDADTISGGDPLVRQTNGTYTASSNDDDVKSNYLEYKKDETTKNTVYNSSGNAVNRDYTLTDMWKTSDPTEAKALLYYPSRVGNDGTIFNAFVYDDNSVYSGTASTDRDKFRIAIWDKRFGDSGSSSPDATDKAYNSDTFILISPSIDRIYFDNVDADGDSDNIMNFKE